MSSHRFGPVAATLALASLGLLAGAACSGTTNNGIGGGSGPGSEKGSGSDPSADDGTGASGDDTGGSGTLATSDAGAKAGKVTDANACVGTATKGQLTPLDMFIMLDQSGSMSEKPTGNTTKWAAVTSGIQAFVGDPATAGMGVGIQFFGLPPSGGSSGGFSRDSCTIADYATAAVPIAPLPGNAGAITQAVKGHSPSTSTPTAPALAGAIQYAQQWAKAHADHVTVVVFATDGDPTECTPQDVPSIAKIAGQGLAGTPSVKTYVIGMAGATTANLDAWAVAGGTTSSYDASDPSKFVSALNAIRGQALTCEYLIPQPDAGTIDYSMVNVQYTVNGQTVVLVQVASKAACDPTTGGWYYDAPTNPKHIEICDSSCSAFKAVKGAEVDVVLGCQTVVTIPK